jgi:hypothetical protein
LNDEEPRFIEFDELPFDLSTVYAEDGERGCPAKRWDGPYSYRCGLGVGICAVHGRYKVKIIEKQD